ncbi:MAG: hypothetical protein KC543_09695 [Myxococcales bacterium]|nr:hypothetical protein [Myxococcales bacterium]
MGKRAASERRAARLAEREAKKQAKIEADALAQRARGRRRAVLAATAVVTVVAAAVCYWGLEDPRATGVALFCGALVILLVGLSAIGGDVQPRDRRSAAALNYGKKK